MSIPPFNGPQLRAARALLGWSARELAEKSRVSLPTIQRIETTNGKLVSQERTILDLAKTLEEAGIEFIGTPERGVGVRFKLVDEN